MILLLGIIINFLPIKLSNIDILLLTTLMKIDIFSTFCIIMFLFIINGSNLIDGFNGLLL